MEPPPPPPSPIFGPDHLWLGWKVKFSPDMPSPFSEKRIDLLVVRSVDVCDKVALSTEADQNDEPKWRVGVPVAMQDATLATGFVETLPG